MTVVFAYFMLSERIVGYKMWQLFIAFGGALLMVLAAPPVPEAIGSDYEA